MKKCDFNIIMDLKEIEYRFDLETKGMKKHCDAWWFWRRVCAREKYQILYDNDKL